MRRLFNIKRKRVEEKVIFDHFLQLWFNYHFLFFHSLIFRGLKLRAFTIFSRIKLGLKSIENFDPSFLFLLAMLKITPSLMIKSIRVSGVLYEVPLPVNYWKKISLSCSWVIRLLKNVNRVVSVQKIVEILSSSILDKGLAISKKNSVYELANLNKHLIKNRIFKR